MKSVIIVFSLFFLVIVKNNLAVTAQFKGYRFEANILTDDRGLLDEFRKDSRKFVHVQEGDEYSIIIKNPLPIRVAVAVSVDGLNVIDGKRAKPQESTKWILNPHSSVTIRGWQTSKRSLRRFVFTREKYSYAKWKEKHDNRNYTRNLGVIGIAYFWDSKELAYVLNPPQPFAENKQRSHTLEKERRYKKKDYKKPKSSERAGTGMGRHDYNPVKKVKFYFDTGMFSNRDVLKIYYEFGKPHHPEPFMGDDDGFTPDMYKHYINHMSHPMLVKAKYNVLLANMRNMRMAVMIYYTEKGKFPRELEDLVKEGHLAHLPDPLPGNWIYSNSTGLIGHSLLKRPRP